MGYNAEKNAKMYGIPFPFSSSQAHAAFSPVKNYYKQKRSTVAKKITYRTSNNWECCTSLPINLRKPQNGPNVYYWLDLIDLSTSIEPVQRMYNKMTSTIQHHTYEDTKVYTIYICKSMENMQYMTNR